MTKIRLSVLALVLLTLACSKSEAPAPQAEKSPEPAAQANEASYELVSAETDISFLIVSNSAGPITGHFPNGASGSLGADGAGSFNIQLDTLNSVDKEGVENPLRDANVVEAFFGVRPSAVMPGPVDEAWSLLTDKLERSVANARFEVKSTEGLEVEDGASGEGSMAGNLVLWNKISIPLTIPLNISRSGDRVEISSTAAASLDLEEVLGTDLRKLVFDTMLAAGCAHQPGIQNKVDITIGKAVFTVK